MKTIEKTRIAWKALFFVLLINVLSNQVTVASLNEVRRQDFNMEMDKSPEFKRYAVELTLTANRFRLKAAGKATEAISQFGTRECARLWDTDVKPLFTSIDMELGDFFSNAVLLIGRIDGFRAVVAFYNPWSDGLCLTEWGRQSSKLEIRQTLFLTGETWRGELSDPNEHYLPKWQRSGETLARALMDPYTETTRLFDRDYPIDGEFLLFPERLQGIQSEDGQRDQLGVLRSRLEFRMVMFKEFLEAPAESDTGLLRRTAVSINRMISSGKKDELEALVKGRQSQAMMDGLFNASESVRSRLSYNCMMLQGNRGIVTMVNPLYPQWFVVLYIDIDVQDGQGLLDSLEMHKFELLKHMGHSARGNRDR